jgi:thioredoxin 1
MTDLVHFTAATFSADVLSSPTPVLVEFGAEWCHPCKLLEPILKELAGVWDGKLKLGQVDVDKDPDLAMQFGVLGVPTLILFMAGQPAERLTGLQPRERLRAKIEQHLPA